MKGQVSKDRSIDQKLQAHSLAPSISGGARERTELLSFRSSGFGTQLELDLGGKRLIGGTAEGLRVLSGTLCRRCLLIGPFGLGTN